MQSTNARLVRLLRIGLGFGACMAPFRLAGQPAWVSIGPDGGSLSRIIQDRSNGNILFSGSTNHPYKLFRSTNKGGTWTGYASLPGVMYCFVQNPKNASELFGGYYGFHRSTNGGLNWSSNYPSNTYFQDVSADSFDQNLLHACGQVYDGSKYAMAYLKSTNKGGAWTNSIVSSSEYGCAYAVFVDPKNSNTIYVGGHVNYVGKVYKTTNGGSGWNDITGIVTGYVYEILVDPVETNRVYAVTSSGVFRSSNNGSNWTKNAGVAYGYVLAQDKKNRNALFAGYYNNVYKSTDWGATWTSYTNGLYGGYCNDVAVDRSNSSNVFYLCSAGFFTSANGGANWSPSNNGIYLADITSVRVAGGTSPVLYAAFYGCGLYKTINPMAKAEQSQAVTWQVFPPFYSCENLTDIQILPTNSNTLYAFEGGG